MKTQYFDESNKTPLVFSPDSKDNSVHYLTEWIRANHATTEQQLLQHGALLFRGFDIETPQDFEAVARSIDNDLKNDYLGTSPRDKKTEYTFSASELPGHYPIMQHCEMSFLPSAPRRLFFYCHVEPVYGGETPVCDFRKVYQQMDKQILAEFESKGVKHIRNYSSPNDNHKSAFQLKKWNEMFLTTDKKIIEEKCRANAIEFEWLKNDGLRMTNKNEAVKVHPITGEKAWFNHTQVFHVHAPVAEYRKIHQRQKRWETFKLARMLEVMTWYKKMTKNPNEQSMHVTFGDDSAIPDAYVDHIIDVIWNNQSAQAWKKGDVICIDNFSTSHGRLPYYGPRNIMVSWTS
ncbi:MAG TPA: TauD/TfdA family dioxygenase [Chitinophagales bacterium]|nr:TauD/TfdA family dioxygenase [Chitinophagales bacterium]